MPSTLHLKAMNMKACVETNSWEWQANATGQVIEVFKTDVEDESDARMIVQMLVERFPGSRVNFDLQDRDRILRIEGNGICNASVVSLVKDAGFSCAILE